jgi:hypothetical protein
MNTDRHHMPFRQMNSWAMLCPVAQPVAQRAEIREFQGFVVEFRHGEVAAGVGQQRRGAAAGADEGPQLVRGVQLQKPVALQIYVIVAEIYLAQGGDDLRALRQGGGVDPGGIAGADEQIHHVCQQIGGGPDLVPGADVHLAQSVYIDVLVNAQLPRSGAELRLVRTLREYLPADNAAQQRAVLQRDGRGKIHKTRVAQIGAGALPVALHASAQPLRALAGQVVAELREVVAAADILAVAAHRHGGKARALRPVLYDLLESGHVAEVRDIQFSRRARREGAGFVFTLFHTIRCRPGAPPGRRRRRCRLCRRI